MSKGALRQAMDTKVILLGEEVGHSTPGACPSSSEA
jgi:hypothetical protein